MSAAQNSQLSLKPSYRAVSIPRVKPYYKTQLGAAYLGDARDLLIKIPSDSVDAVVTSPPYALHFKKEYGNVAKEDYVEWFLEFVREFHRILKDDGSFVLNIGGSYNKGLPTRSVYQYKLLIDIVEKIGFHLAQEFYWYNPAKLPMPAEWVTVRRIRVKDAVEHVWWLGKFLRIFTLVLNNRSALDRSRLRVIKRQHIRMFKVDCRMGSHADGARPVSKMLKLSRAYQAPSSQESLDNAARRAGCRKPDRL